jgi:autotransporter strand-loop-strand O-heptosyltransferase
MKKLKICQVNPGIIEIPPKSWGAIEKVIWNYKIQLERLGHQCDIQLPWDVKKDNYDIIHVHTPNQCVDDMVKYNNVPYIFSNHDHHCIKWGKNSNTFNLNMEAIKKSMISLTFSDTMVDYFYETDKLFFISHGVDTELYKYKKRDITKHKLLCVGNNGYADNQSYDRKGFSFAIKAAMVLDMDITIVGPKNNDNFFNENSELLKYDKLNIIYDPDEKELIDIYNSHSIFIHPSELEAGHPNLTLLEAMSCGLPIVGTCDRQLDGLEPCNRDVDSIVNKVNMVIENYDNYKNNAIDTAKKHDWSNIVKTLEGIYYNVLNIKDEYTHEMFRKKLIYLYDTTDKRKNDDVVNIKTNFNKHAFVEILSPSEKNYTIEFINDDNNKIHYKSTIKSNMWSKVDIEYFTNWKINISYDDKNITRRLDLFNKNVLISFDSKSLGDTIAWFPYVEEFRKKHNCIIYCSTFINELFLKEYPHINFINPGQVVENVYTSYKIGWFSPPWGGPRNMNPVDYRLIPLQKTASDILGLEYREIKPKITIEDSPRPIEEKYICMATTSTASAKLWHYKNGWQILVDYFNSMGYKVMVIQKEGTLLNPKTIINETGNQPLKKRIQQLKHCEFFIGLSSGLSWLSWVTGKKTIMISGFTKPFCEFISDNIRIHNDTVCNGCMNDIRYEFDRGDWDWCPVNKYTEKMFECSKNITPEQVINKINENGLLY